MTTALQIKGLKKTYNDSFEALKGIDLNVSQGDFFALLGPNGAGKSTTIGIISSLVKKTAGEVNIFGVDIDQDFSSAKLLLGLVPQEFNFNMFEKVIDIIINQAGYYGLPRKLGIERAEKYLKQLGLWDKRYQQAKTLSGGMKRRLMIARALVHEPRLLILDEPTAGVDIELRRSMWDFLREINEQGTTIILTTHYLEEAESLCRNIAIIAQGKIIQHSSMRDLLGQLNTETFVFDFKKNVDIAFSVEGYLINAIESNSIEVTINRGQTLNALFDVFSQKEMSVTSMRNKVNRLEELFVNIVKEGNTNIIGASI